jgi:transcriptional regulator with XRE-family HTH domain
VTEASDLAARLREARIRRDITQEALAAQAEIGLSTLRRIEQGQVVEPGFFTIKAIGQALGLSLTLQDVAPTPQNELVTESRLEA